MREVFDMAVARAPEAVALVDGDKRYTFGEWQERVRRAAALLWQLGVRRGDRVVQIQRNREENCTVHFACQIIGAVNTPLNVRWSAGEIAFGVNDAEPKVVVFESALARVVAEAKREFAVSPEMICVGEEGPAGVLEFEGALRGVSGGPPEVMLGEGDLSVMLYTSGTTGRPKGVLRSQRAEYAATVGQIIQHELGAGERTLGVMPLFHTMGLHTLTSMVALNGMFVAMREWSARAAVELVERERISYLYLVPTMYHMLVHDEELARREVRSVRKLAYAGAPMSSTLVRACLEKFRPSVFVNHYGSTEVYTHSIFKELERKPGCAGRAAFHTQLRVVRVDPGAGVRPEETVGRGEMGEVIVRMGDEAFSGYFRRPEATERAIRDGWYFTGDTGYVDEDGDLWVTGRVDDMIITGGENVYPVEVEEVLARHPKVADVAVAGLPDERWGQVVTAFVVARDPSLTAEELDRFCLESRELSRFKRPRRYFFVQEIPRSASGKTLRRVLVGEYGGAGITAGDSRVLSQGRVADERG